VNDDMTAATIVAGAVTLLFALVGPHLAGKLPPATATRPLVPACWSTSGRTPSLRPRGAALSQDSASRRHLDAGDATAVEHDKPVTVLASKHAGVLRKG
jgi:hypothetical protein